VPRVPQCRIFQELQTRIYKPFLQTITSTKNRILFFPKK
jgi:hypothetical protein